MRNPTCGLGLLVSLLIVAVSVGRAQTCTDDADGDLTIPTTTDPPAAVRFLKRTDPTDSAKSYLTIESIAIASEPMKFKATASPVWQIELRELNDPEHPGTLLIPSTPDPKATNPMDSGSENTLGQVSITSANTVIRQCGTNKAELV